MEEGNYSCFHKQDRLFSLFFRAHSFSLYELSARYVSKCVGGYLGMKTLPGKMHFDRVKNVIPSAQSNRSMALWLWTAD